MKAPIATVSQDDMPRDSYGAIICWGGDKPEKLLRALHSLKNQVLTVSQLIIVGDGLGADQIAAYKNVVPGTMLITTTHRLGPAGARNFGMRHMDARIQYVLVQDADDVSHPMRALTQMQSMSLGQADVVGSQAVLLTPKSGRICGLPPRPVGIAEVTSGLIGGRMTMVHPSIMFRRALFDAVGGYPNIRDRGEDFAMLQLMARDGARLTNLSTNLYGYDHSLIRSPFAYYSDVKLRVPNLSEAMLRYLGHTGSRMFHSRLSSSTKAEWRKILQETQAVQ